MKARTLVSIISLVFFISMVGTAPEVDAYNRKTIKAKKITFNHSGSVAIALKDHTRPDYDEDVPTPEYIKGRRNEPVAYPVGSTLSIQVIFKAKQRVESAWIGSSFAGWIGKPTCQRCWPKTGWTKGGWQSCWMGWTKCLRNAVVMWSML